MIIAEANCSSTFVVRQNMILMQLHPTLGIYVAHFGARQKKCPAVELI